MAAKPSAVSGDSVMTPLFILDTRFLDDFARINSRNVAHASHHIHVYRGFVASLLERKKFSHMGGGIGANGGKAQRPGQVTGCPEDVGFEAASIKAVATGAVSEPLAVRTSVRLCLLKRGGMRVQMSASTVRRSYVLLPSEWLKHERIPRDTSNLPSVHSSEFHFWEGSRAEERTSTFTPSSIFQSLPRHKPY